MTNTKTTKPTKPTVVIQEFRVSAPDPWGRISWAQILPILMARITAQGYTVKLEEHTNE